MALGIERKTLLLTSALCAVIATAAPASAQDAAAEGATTVEEVIIKSARQNRVVSAGTKTDTPLQEVPQGISVVTADQLETLKTTTLSNVLNYVPGLMTQPETNARYADQVQIRGFNADPGTGNFLRDGLKLQSNIYDGSQEGYGLERIDVLRGAASVLYGQVSPAGVVNTVSKKPTFRDIREVQVEVGTYERKQIAGDIAGAIGDSDVWNFRLTGVVRDSETWTDYINDDKIYFAPGIGWRPSADTQVYFLGTFTQTKTKFSAPLPLSATLLTTANGTRIPFERFVGEPGYDDFSNRSFTVGYLVDHRISDSLAFHQGLRFFRSDSDIDYLQLGANVTNNRTLTRSVVHRFDDSQGLTADSNVTWKGDTGAVQHTVLAGVDYYGRLYDTFRFGGTAPTLDFVTPTYGGVVTTNSIDTNGVRQTGKQLGVYLQDSMKIADRWVVLLSGRKDWSKFTSVSHATGARTVQNDEAWTGRAGLVYLFDSGLAPYASYAQSFVPQIGADRFAQPFEPTRGEQYEAGVRFVPKNSLMVLTGSVYDLRQTNVTTPDPVNTSFLIQTGEVRSRGVELEAKLQLFKNVNLIAAYTYTDARTTKTNRPADLGQRVTTIPYNMASVWGDYRFADFGLPGLRLGAAVRYVGSTHVTGVARDVPEYTLVDLYGSYEHDRWRFAINAKNVGDKQYLFCNVSTFCRYGDPRMVIATLAYRY